MIRSAVILAEYSQDTAARPLMLQELLFSPVLSWVVESLRLKGIERFFVLSGPEFLEKVKTLCPDAQVVSADAPDRPAKQQAFVDEVNGEVLLVNRPMWFPFCGGAPVEITAENLYEVQEKARLDRVLFLERQGVRFIDRASVWIDPRVTVEPGTVILPGTILRGRTEIGEGCEIGPNTMLRDVIVGDHAVINSSQGADCVVGNGVTVGPFSNLRPGTVLGEAVHIGDFVETKNTVIGKGTWVSHLTYLGDADVGEYSNFGCGVVTANFDGEHKYRTTIGSNAFIGCNTNLIAPVTVEDGGYTAAGTTVTERVPAEALAIGRVRQENKPEWAKGKKICF